MHNNTSSIKNSISISLRQGISNFSSASPVVIGLHKYKSLYYPAAGEDIEILVEMMRVFPELKNVTFSSIYYGVLAKFDENPYEITSIANVRQLYEGIREHFILKKLNKYELPGGIQVDKLKLRLKEDERKKIGFTLISRDLYCVVPSHLKSPTIHIINVPGDNSSLSFEAYFYPKIIKDMKIGDLLLIQNAALPLSDKTIPWLIGLQSLRISELGLKEPKVILKERNETFLVAYGGWQSYLKLRNVDPYRIMKIWLQDHTEELGDLDSQSPHFSENQWIEFDWLPKYKKLATKRDFMAIEIEPDFKRGLYGRYKDGGSFLNNSETVSSPVGTPQQRNAASPVDNNKETANRWVNSLTIQQINVILWHSKAHFSHDFTGIKEIKSHGLDGVWDIVRKADICKKDRSGYVNRLDYFNYIEYILKNESQDAPGVKPILEILNSIRSKKESPEKKDAQLWLFIENVISALAERFITLEIEPRIYTKKVFFLDAALGSNDINREYFRLREIYLRVSNKIWQEYKIKILDFEDLPLRYKFLLIFNFCWLDEEKIIVVLIGWVLKAQQLLKIKRQRDIGNVMADRIERADTALKMIFEKLGFGYSSIVERARFFVLEGLRGEGESYVLTKDIFLDVKIFSDPMNITPEHEIAHLSVQGFPSHFLNEGSVELLAIRASAGAKAGLGAREQLLWDSPRSHELNCILYLMERIDEQRLLDAFIEGRYSFFMMQVFDFKLWQRLLLLEDEARELGIRGLKLKRLIIAEIEKKIKEVNFSSSPISYKAYGLAEEEGNQHIAHAGYRKMKREWKKLLKIRIIKIERGDNVYYFIVFDEREG
ncbi:MAG: hypothetical protein AABY43_03420 [Candidatus Omnitrophota bacterium]